MRGSCRGVRCVICDLLFFQRAPGRLTCSAACRKRYRALYNRIRWALLPQNAGERQRNRERFRRWYRLHRREVIERVGATRAAGRSRRTRSSNSSSDARERADSRARRRIVG